MFLLVCMSAAYTLADLAVDYPEMFRLHASAAQARARSRGAGPPPAVLQPMAGSPPARAQSEQGQTFLRLNCLFETADLRRAGWDIPLRADLRGAAGIRFQIRSQDLSAVSYFTFFFKSGDGWYVAEFSPRDDGRWQEIEILKSQTTLEGSPSGWREITAFRFSAWRNHAADTTIDLAGFGLIPADRRIAVVRGSHDFFRLPAGERSSVLTYARRSAELLRDNQTTPAWIEETDLDQRFLARVRVVILPYNPQIPDTAARALTEFARRGGRIVGFHTMPSALSPATGLRQAGMVRAAEAGGLARISMVEPGLAGAPAQVEQSSWIISLFQGLERPPQVLARWLNSQGRYTGHPALLQTETTLWLSHVLINAESDQGGRLLLAMVGHFMPELWREVSEKRLQELRPPLPYQDFNQAFRQIRQPANRQAEHWLSVAAGRRRAAYQALAGGDYPRVIIEMDEAERALTEAYLRVQIPRANEFRAAWCHHGDGVADWGWERTIQTLRRSGFNAMIANLAHPAMAWYPSRHLPPAPGVRNRRDRLAELTAAGRRYGVEAHVWIMLFRLGNERDSDWIESLRRDQRLMVNRDGTVDHDWLCPADPRNQRMLLAAIREIAENYEVDGIHLDYVRYPSPDSGFGSEARRLFEQEIGRRLDDWPQVLAENPELARRWREFRVRQINRFVEQAARMVREARPGAKLSAAVFRNEATAVGSIAQDWPEWARRGWVDFITPMNYTDQVDGFIHATRRQLNIGRRYQVDVYPGIGLTTDRLGSVGTARQIEAARQLGAPGFVIFEINQDTASTVFPDLGKGATREQPE